MPPTIDCRPLPAFALDDPASVRAAFREATPIPFRQAWLETPERDFVPGSVRTGWREDSLLVLADLFDVDVFTRAERHNERFWELGDTFEMFLQPAGSQAYVELHVAPNSLRLQLRFREAAVSIGRKIRLPRLSFTTRFLIHEHGSSGRTRLEVFAQVRAAAVGHGSGPLASSTWRFSFGRYDAKRAARNQ